MGKGWERVGWVGYLCILSTPQDRALTWWRKGGREGEREDVVRGIGQINELFNKGDGVT